MDNIPDRIKSGKPILIHVCREPDDNWWLNKNEDIPGKIILHEKSSGSGTKPSPIESYFRLIYERYAKEERHYLKSITKDRYERRYKALEAEPPSINLMEINDNNHQYRQHKVDCLIKQIREKVDIMDVEIQDSIESFCGQIIGLFNEDGAPEEMKKSLSEILEIEKKGQNKKCCKALDIANKMAMDFIKHIMQTTKLTPAGENSLGNYGCFSTSLTRNNLFSNPFSRELWHC